MDQVLKILHLEDNSTDAFLIERELKKADFNFETKLVETRDQFIDALQNFKPQLILSDHSLPQFNSIEALQIYKEHQCEIPFILITGSVSEEFATRCIKEGADDYILKNNLIRLPSAITQALKARKIESDKHKAHSELEIINKELSTFIYKAAHDLRGPVCSIQGLINVAAIQEDLSTLPSLLGKISESTSRLDSILLSLMEVMTIKTETPYISEINFKALIARVLERLKGMPGYSSTDFNICIANEGGFISDPSILTSVFFNLLENSIKFRNSNNLITHISIEVNTVETGIEIKIVDNGVGMSESVQEKIFDMYFKGDQFSKSTGLGLYVTMNGVKKLGGTIDVTSMPGMGSTFLLSLPSYLVHLS